MAGRGKFPDTKWKKLKESAMTYFKRNNATQELEALLNKLALVKPDDLYGYMSQYFYTLAKEPEISMLRACEGVAGNGGRSVDVQIQATVCGQDKIIGRASVPLYLEQGIAPPSTVNKGGPRKSPRNSARQGEARMVPFKVGPVETVMDHLSMGLVGTSVKDQVLFDRTCEEMKESAASNGHILHPSSLLAVSLAAAIAGAQLSLLPLFLHLSSLYYKEDMADIIAASPPLLGPTPPLRDETSASSADRESIDQGDVMSPSTLSPTTKGSCYLPTPVVAVLRKGSGKLKVQEFCILPFSGASVQQQAGMLRMIYTELGKLLSSKFGSSASCTQPNSPYAPTVDKAEQAMQWIEEAATAAGFQCGKDVGVMIDVGAERLYDMEKEKYELIAGPTKSADDIISLYSDIIQSFKSVVGFIDPLHSKDVQGWKKLVDKLGSKCLLIPDGALESGLSLAVKGRLDTSMADPDVETDTPEACGMKIEEPLPKEDEVDVACVALTWSSTVSATVARIEHLKGQSLGVMMRVPFTLTGSSGASIDLAVASQCSFIRLGAPCGLTTVLLSRMFQIREELMHRMIDIPVIEDPIKCLLEKQT